MSSEPHRNAVVLDTTQLDALRRSLTLFPAGTRGRGERYLREGRVATITGFERGITARVLGSGTFYETLWHWTGRGWESECSCPIGGFCKHAYAVGRAALQNAGASALAPSKPGGRPAAAAALRPVAVIDRLRDATESWARRGFLAQLLRPATAAGLPMQSLDLDRILDDPDPDLLCWRLARRIGDAFPEHLPPALAPYRDRPDLAERYASRERTGLVTELVRWAERQRTAPARGLRLVFSFAREFGRIALTVEVRVTSPRLTDEARSLHQLQQLRSDARNTPGLLAPAQAALLELFTDGASDLFGGHSTHGTRWALPGRGLKALLRRLAGTDLASWAPDVDPELAARGGIEPGGRLRVCEDPARLLPTCIERDGQTLVELAFFWPDGRRRLLGEALHLPRIGLWDSGAQPTFVVAGGELSVVVEEPEQSIVERFREAGTLVVPRAERGELLGHLATSFPHLRQTLAAHTRLHPARPIVALDLRDDDWLQVRLFAHGGAGQWKPGDTLAPSVATFEHEPSGRWVRIGDERATDAGGSGYESVSPESEAGDDATPAAGEASAVPEEIWIEAPAPESVESALRWMSSLPLAAGTRKRASDQAPDAADRNVGWWMHATPMAMAALAESWEERPSDVAFFGTARIKRLLAGEIVLRPRLRIESSGIDWFSVSAEWEGEGLRLSDADLAKLRSAKSPFVKLSSGWARSDAAALHDEAAGVLADLGVEIGTGPQRVSMWQLAGAAPESVQTLERLGADRDTLDAAHELRRRVAEFDGLPRIAPPAGFVAELRPYQARGLDFLGYASAFGIGAVLADDMGLGKTVQALAWLSHLRAIDPDGGPSLVVCPASVVYNWAREAERFAPELRVLLLTRGTGRRERFAQVASHDLVVTNYALLRRDVEAWREVTLRALILDEAQNLKNPDAAVTGAVQSIPARHRIALTGTPLENRALDLWSIVECVNPGYLGARSRFEARFDRVDAPPHVRTLLAAKLRPILLRRTKGQVATDLPDRIEERIDCELAREQRLLYLDELRRSRAMMERLAGVPGGLARNKIHVLAALTRLRQLCCHPALAGGRPGLASGKFDALFELLEPLMEEGHKVLVFSQFVECLKLLETALAGHGIAYHMLTGSTLKREQVVGAFDRDERPCVFLVSLKAGGTGLNLTAASYVVLFDPWWNPAVEAQAIDRTHRIGQDRSVIAYRLIARGTIEEKIFELQQRKAALARDVLGEGGFARALTRGDLDYLFADT